MKKSNVILPFGLVGIIILVIIGCLVSNYLHDKGIGGLEYKVSSILSEEAIKAETIFKSNEKLFNNVADEIEILPSTITDITIYNDKIFHITKEGTNSSGEQPISDISKQLENAVGELNSNNIYATISLNHDLNGISFTVFNDSDGACFYEIDIVRSKNGMIANKNIIKLDDNWYIVKSINWGT